MNTTATPEDNNEDLQKILQEINAVFQNSAKNLDEFTKELFSIAKETGSSCESAAKVASEFSRQGLGIDEVLKRTRDALILSRLSGLEMEESVKCLKSAVESFAQSNLQTKQIVDKLASVDASFAVSCNDIAKALERSAVAAQNAIVSFDELISLITIAQQTTARGGEVIGNALKTIFTRIARKDVLDALKSYGVETVGSDGSALSAVTILKNVAKEYSQKAGKDKMAIAELLGGIYQINILKAILADFQRDNSVFESAKIVVNISINEAEKKNEALSQNLAEAIKNSVIETLKNESRKGGFFGR